MAPNEPQSLPDWIENAYQIILSRINGPEGSLSRQQAHELLVAHEDFPNEETDAKHAVDRLLDTGWLYEVNNELRITDPES